MTNEHERPHGHEYEEQEDERPEAGEVAKPGPRIYVASLSDYNAGRLHGAWIDATQETEQLHAEIAAMLERSPEPLAEEWAIHDYEGFHDTRISEYESLERISLIANGIAEHGPPFAAWISTCDPSEETVESFQEAFRGNYPSREAYAEEIVDDLGYQQIIDEAIPGYLAAYVSFDADAFIHDSELNGDITIVDAPDGTVFVFDGHA